ncbi:MAG: hypothetical protein VW835_04965 [Rickettsiales bacterium]
MDALTGVNDGRLGAADPRQAAQLRLERLRTQVVAGEVDTTRLQQRLTSALGEDAEGIVGEDGSVDFERLQSFIADQGSARLLLELTARLGDRVDVAEENGGVDGSAVRESIVDRSRAIARERLREEFGDDAQNFNNGDGSIDFEALREVLERQQVDVERLRNLELRPAALFDFDPRTAASAPQFALQTRSVRY